VSNSEFAMFAFHGRWDELGIAERPWQIIATSTVVVIFCNFLLLTVLFLRF
jgi:hypothetical protein